MPLAQTGQDQRVADEPECHRGPERLCGRQQHRRESRASGEIGAANRARPYERAMHLQTGLFALALVILVVGVFSAGRARNAEKERHLYTWCLAASVVGSLGALVWLMA